MLVYKLYNTLTNLGIALDSAGWQFFRLLCYVSFSYSFSYLCFIFLSFNLYTEHLAVWFATGNGKLRRYREYTFRSMLIVQEVAAETAQSKACGGAINRHWKLCI